MKHLYCKCGHLVAILSPGSKIQPGSTVTCRECAKRDGVNGDSDLPDFMKSIFGKS